MRIADVLRNKGAGVATITPETSVSGLLNELTLHNIGAMVVVGPDGVVGHGLSYSLLLAPLLYLLWARRAAPRRPAT